MRKMQFTIKKWRMRGQGPKRTGPQRCPLCGDNVSTCRKIGILDSEDLSTTPGRGGLKGEQK